MGKWQLIIVSVHYNNSDCSSQKFVPGPGLVLPGCLGIKTETCYIEGKKHSLTLFWHVLINLYRARTEAAGL